MSSKQELKLKQRNQITNTKLMTGTRFTDGDSSFVISIMFKANCVSLAF